MSISYRQFNKESSALAFSLGLGPDLPVMSPDNMASDINTDAPAKPVNFLGFISSGKCFKVLKIYNFFAIL
jgi:hypothetical protein